MTGNGYVSNSEPWWMVESREAQEALSSPHKKCGAIKPGPGGYAPCTWTVCTQDEDHQGAHSGPEFKAGPVVTWGGLDRSTPPVPPAHDPACTKRCCRATDGCQGPSYPPVASEDGCDHQWLDRPESDTRECLICGEERHG